MKQTIIFVIIFIINLHSYLLSNNKENKIVFDPKASKNLSIISDISDIKIHSTNDKLISISIRYTGNKDVLDNNEITGIIKDNSTFEIISTQKKTKPFYNGSIKLDIYLPKIFENLFINTNIGNININDYNTKKIEVRSNTGNILINNYFNSLIATSDVGNIDIEPLNMNSTISATSNVGNINLIADPKGSYIFNLKTNVGNISAEDFGITNISSIPQKNITKKVNYGKYTINLKTNVGNIVVESK